MNSILSEDLKSILDNLTSEEKKKFNNSTILLTGAGGFLGYYFMHFFSRFAHELKIKKVIALENFLTGSRDWLENLARESKGLVQLYQFDVITDSLNEIPGTENADLIIHLASIASPTYYRKYPIETVDANITGLRRLLDFYADKTIKGLLFFSSSEVYGDPFPEFIPTSEEYRGNVSTTGPRACYDEAKRFGETLCYLFADKYAMPVTIVRPFNNFGPGMNVNDKRLPADFARAVLENKDLQIFSDGKPTRTFCYISDAINGYLKALLHGQFNIFNIGTDKPEISVSEFAEIFEQKGNLIFNFNGKVSFQKSPEKEYLTDNPNRRCPDITKASKILGYKPSKRVEEGVERYLKFLYINKGQL